MRTARWKWCERKRRSRKIEVVNNDRREEGCHESERRDDDDALLRSAVGESANGDGVDVEGQLRLLAGGGCRAESLWCDYGSGYLHRARNAESTLRRGAC